MKTQIVCLCKPYYQSIIISDRVFKLQHMVCDEWQLCRFSNATPQSLNYTVDNSHLSNQVIIQPNPFWALVTGRAAPSGARSACGWPDTVAGRPHIRRCGSSTPS